MLYSRFVAIFQSRPSEALLSSLIPAIVLFVRRRRQAANPLLQPIIPWWPVVDKRIEMIWMHIIKNPTILLFIFWKLTATIWRIRSSVGAALRRE
jgi:hypothetical protein